MEKTKSATQKENNRGNEIIRIQKKKNNFVLLDKGFFEDTRLTWKAKGILGYLLTKPDGWKVIVKDIVKHGVGGERAIYNGLNELKKYGYYRKYPVREGQRIVRWESVIYECPEDYQENKKINKTIKNNKKDSKPMEEPNNSLLRGFVHVENEDVAFVHVENSERNNINTNSNKDFNENEISIYPSETEEPTPEKNDSIDLIDTHTVIKTYTPEEVAEKICLDELKEQYPEEQEEIDLINDCICEILTVENPVDPICRISRQPVPFVTVKNIFAQLDKNHVGYVIDCLNNNGNKYKINKNTKSYIMTSLFHAPRTISHFHKRDFKKPEPEKSTYTAAFAKKWGL